MIAIITKHNSSEYTVEHIQEKYPNGMTTNHFILRHNGVQIATIDNACNYVYDNYMKYVNSLARINFELNDFGHRLTESEFNDFQDHTPTFDEYSDHYDDYRSDYESYLKDTFYNSIEEVNTEQEMDIDSDCTFLYPNTRIFEPDSDVEDILADTSEEPKYSNKVVAKNSFNLTDEQSGECGAFIFHLSVFHTTLICNNIELYGFSFVIIDEESLVQSPNISIKLSRNRSDAIIVKSKLNTSITMNEEDCHVYINSFNDNEYVERNIDTNLILGKSSDNVEDLY